ncbi:MAG: 7-carboxy-7-deazaguanine synthase QueE [Ignavibacteria bacterium]
MHSLNISELFYSIQGEGKKTGTPSFFIRTNYCNLRCQFVGGNLCDTPYTSWSPEDSKNLGRVTIEYIISQYREFYPSDVVITGGEPTLQRTGLIELCSALKKLDKKIFVTLETNGTRYGEYVKFIDLISISPKLATSIPSNEKFKKLHLKNRLNFNILRQYELGARQKIYDIQWKFVVTSEKDIGEILQIQKKVNFPNNTVYLMPEGISRSDLSLKRKLIVNLCKQYNFNYCERLQILIWGNKRGV